MKFKGIAAVLAAAVAVVLGIAGAILLSPVPDEPTPTAEGEPGVTALTDYSLPDPLTAGWEGRSVCDLLHEDTAQRVLRCTFPPGVGHERHYHAPHFGYALTSATMQITDEDGTREQNIPAGTHWVSEDLTRHEALNIGDTIGIYLIFENR